MQLRDQRQSGWEHFDRGGFDKRCALRSGRKGGANQFDRHTQSNTGDRLGLRVPSLPTSNDFTPDFTGPTAVVRSEDAMLLVH